MLATAPLATGSTAVLDDQIAEIRTWDSGKTVGCAGPPYSDEFERDSPMSMAQIARDLRVDQLVTMEFDDSDQLMRELQHDLKRGDRRLAAILAGAVLDQRYDADARGLALETLAAARVRWFEPQTVDVIKAALDSNELELQFAAIAAASDLSQAQQVSLSRVIRRLIDAPSIDATVKAAAASFLRRVDRLASRE